VLTVDTKTKRIALSIKALQEPSAPRAKQGTPKKAAPAPLSMIDSLAALSNKWRVN
jgi:uncharacterized protein